MSVLIKGMKMPEKCGLCDLFHVESPMHCTVVKGHKTVGAPYGMTRPDWCPLVEIPEPYGRLVDDNAMYLALAIIMAGTLTEGDCKAETGRYEEEDEAACALNRRDGENR